MGSQQRVRGALALGMLTGMQGSRGGWGGGYP